MIERIEHYHGRVAVSAARNTLHVLNNSDWLCRMDTMRLTFSIVFNKAARLQIYGGNIINGDRGSILRGHDAIRVTWLANTDVIITNIKPKRSYDIIGTPLFQIIQLLEQMITRLKATHWNISTTRAGKNSKWPAFAAHRSSRYLGAGQVIGT